VYNPTLGRWINRDPIGEDGPGGTNLYAYVENDPINDTDPEGLTTKSGFIHCPCGKTYYVPASTIIDHVALRHGPSVHPTTNVVQRGVWSHEAWSAYWAHQILYLTLCFPSYHGTNSQGGTFIAPNTIQHYVNGAPIVPTIPIGMLYGPGGSNPTPTSWVTVYTTPGNVVTSFFPSGPPPIAP